ncbi:hypothetical protein L227DRAFT_147585 [Lentinus tigrinus ALCF2SS1-6]|uniref:Uncharacterized protein n=1 Tax=Lentinus tigrinus ALCF2SS1-6 TaxID=1328759 RepID=A0A5C2STU5_9APHY|nr:hypothetical protein L227DRAFT_147585 [Lentinus tigrinus ALCF2SS1-6]
MGLGRDAFGDRAMALAMAMERTRNGHVAMVAGRRLERREGGQACFVLALPPCPSRSQREGASDRTVTDGCAAPTAPRVGWGRFLNCSGTGSRCAISRLDPRRPGTGTGTVLRLRGMGTLLPNALRRLDGRVAPSGLRVLSAAWSLSCAAMGLSRRSSCALRAAGST